MGSIALASLPVLFLVLAWAVRGELRDAETQATRRALEVESPYRATANPPSPPARRDRRARLGRAILFAVVFAPLTPAWLALLGDPSLPVEPPRQIIGGSCDGGHDVSLDASMIAALAAFAIGYLVLRFAPAIVVAVRDRRRRDVPTPRGDRLLRAALVAGTIALAAAALRLVLAPTYAPDAFSIYGAITPDGARGGAIDAFIARSIARGAELRPVERGADFPNDIDPRSDCHSEFCLGPSPRLGLMARVGGAPYAFDRDDDGPLVAHHVLDRAGGYDDRRPQFATMPRWAPGRQGGEILVERRDDGTTLALHLHGGSAEAIAIAEVGALLAPPLTVLAILCASVVAGVVVARSKTRRHLLRLVAAWAIVESIVAFAVLWSPYLP